jgi:hypothetical protein
MFAIVWMAAAASALPNACRNFLSWLVLICLAEFAPIVAGYFNPQYKGGTAEGRHYALQLI